jgi:hypothetical protein
MSEIKWCFNTVDSTCDRIECPDDFTAMQLAKHLANNQIDCLVGTLSHQIVFPRRPNWLIVMRLSEQHLGINIINENVGKVSQ